LRHPIAVPASSALPRALQVIAWSRTVRWIGWGFGESLIPIFIFSFSRTYAEAGLIRSVFEIVLLICLPIAGVLADRIPARTLVLAGLVVYPLVGVGYLLAGVTGFALFLVLARIANAVGWSLESTGVDTYYRRMAPHRSMSSSFGFIDTLAGSGWVVAALIGMLLVPFVPIHYLLFLVAPTSILAYIIAAWAPHDPPRSGTQPPGTNSVMQSYRLMLTEWRMWGGNLRLLGALSFFVGIIEALIWFFIPIDAYVEGAKLSLVILLTVVASIPPMFGYAVGKIADRRNPYTLIAAGLVGTAALLILIAIFPHHIFFKLVASFSLGVLLELFAVIEKGLVTTLGPSATYGRRGGAFASIGDLGDIAAPLILGVTLDTIGFPGIASIVAVIALIMSGGFALMKSRKPVPLPV